MKLTKVIAFLTLSVALTACENANSNRSAAPTNANTTTSNTAAATNSNNANASGSAAAQTLSEVPVPSRIREMSETRGEQDAAAPTLTVVEPKDNANIASSTVKVKLNLGGDLKGYKPMKDPQTGMGNHIHVILDNQPYEAYYNLDQEFELRNVADGEHTLRVFPSRPWHESYKNAGAFQIVRFTVKNGGANAAQPTTTNAGQTMANANAASGNAAPEGKEMANSVAGSVDRAKPLLTYSRPKGEYKGVDADPIMLDFWLANVKLIADGGEYRVRYSIDNGEAKFLDHWQPVWVSGWTAGKHTVKLELVDRAGNLVDNGGYNSTTREITVVK